MKYDAIIYDLDGTVLNTFDMNVYPLQKILKEELGVDMNYDELVTYMNIPGLKILQDFNIKNHEEVYKRWVSYVNDYEDGATIYYNFDEVIQKLENKVKQGVVSSKMTEQYHIDVDGKDLHQFFGSIILQEDTKNHKPHTEPLLTCAKELGVDPKKCLYIGDNLTDYQSAINAGMDFALASWGNIEIEGIDNPTYILDRPDDLLEIIKE